jgi:hypothetical protein
VVGDKAKMCRPVDFLSSGRWLRSRSDHAGLTLAHSPEPAMSGLMKTSQQLSLCCSRAVSLAFALLCFVGAAGSAHAASAGPQNWPSSSPQVTSQFAIADFDGDSRPDLATVQAGQSSSVDTQYWIAFQLSSGPRRTLGITAPPGGLQVTSVDVNGDDSLDVILTTAWTNRPVAVLLNDGQGNFRSSSPSAFPGAFTNSKKSCVYTTDESKDATAILLSRYPSGNCSEGSRFSSPRNVTRLHVPWASFSWPLSAVVPFLGRAPPSFVLHI